MEEYKKKIGFLTCHYDWDKAYSITSVIHDQLLMNLRHGYKPVLFVLPSFKDDARVPEGVEIRKVVPQLLLEAYKNFGIPQEHEKNVRSVVQVLVKESSDIDVMIAHHLHFIDTFYPYCEAIHQLTQYDLIKAKWLLWTHSAPSRREVESPHRLRYIKPKNAKLVYLNNYHSIALAEMYGAWPSDVRVVHNSVDPTSFWNLDGFVI